MEYNKQLLHRFMTEKVAVHVKTQEKYNQFMKLLEKETDIIWQTGLKPTEHDYWNSNGRNTVIYGNYGLAFGNIQDVNCHGYTVIELSDLIKEENNMKYRQKPVVIEAFQYDGDLKGSDGNWYVPQWAEDAFKNETLFYDSSEEDTPPWELFIKSLEGNIHVSVGDYIIKGVNRELYPCKPDIFEKTYEKVEGEIL